jgi:NitT/TauT family transport system substrate-binding protein
MEACDMQIPSLRRILAGLAGLAVLAVLALLILPRVMSRAEPLQVGYIPIIPMTQLFVLAGEGWAREAGLDLQTTSFASGPAMVQALASGQLDAAYVGIGPVLIARTKGIDLKVVAANVVEPVALIGRGTFAADFAKASNPAEAFRRFRATAGRPARVATLPPGSVPDTVLRYWLGEVAHVAPQDVEILGIGEDQVQQALLAGAVEAAMIQEPILTIVQQREPSAHILAPGGALLPGQPGAVLAVRERTIRDHRDAVAKLVGLHVRATAFARTEPARAAADITGYIGKGLVEPAVIEKALTSPETKLIADPHAILGPTGVLQEYQRKLGTLAQPVPLDTLFDTSFYDALPR